MIKASSLYYAIMICVLVGLSCASFLMVSHYSKIHSLILETQTSLLTTNASATNYFLASIDAMENATKKIDVFENGILSEGIVSQWGFYKILKVSSVFKNDTITQQTLLGRKNTTRTALYLTDNDKPLQMVGKAKIIGNAFVPEKGIKKGYLTSQSFSTFKFLNGEKYTSSDKLPKINGVFKTPELASHNTKLMEEVKERETLYNSFDKETLEIQMNEHSFNYKKILGNVIIRSKDSLFIKKENILEDVLIIAPKVVFEKGFKGTVQVKATEGVTLQEKVILKYPSGIFIDNSKAEKIEIVLSKDTKLLGSIVVTASSSVNKGVSLVSIQKDAELVGTLYCNGSTELKGKITGSVYTNNFYLKTKASSYENYIEDGIIDQSSFPDFFLGSSFTINGSDNNTYGVIKSL